MDINTPIIVTIIISSLTFAIGYFIAKNQAKQTQHDIEKLNIEAQTELKNINTNLDELKQNLTQTSEQLQQTIKKLNEQRENNAAITSQIEAKEEQLQTNAKQLIELQNKHDENIAELAKLKTSLDERDNNHKEQLKSLEQCKEDINKNFKVLAKDVLDVQTESLQKSSKTSIDAIINPFKDSLNEFKKEVKNIHHLDTQQQTEIKTELQNMQNMTNKISNEAHELSTALKGQKKMQGNWGELMLENILDSSGLKLGIDYNREVSFTAEDGKKQRPDVIVNLPQQKHLIIDAKVSLNAYSEYVNSEDEEQSEKALAEHVTAIRARIKDLSKKNYHKITDINSPAIVFMFIPIESAFIAAVTAEPTLFQAAIDQQILVATPTTLLTSLNIVKQLWRYEDQNKHTAALANKAVKVYDKLRLFLESFSNVKKSLDKATEAYTEAEKRLINGNGNLVKQVDEFKELAPAIQDQLPSYFTDKAELELDNTEQPDEQEQNTAISNADAEA